ncbi:MAG TPA: hypothetical protein VFY45_24270 [Baekduia sp.]|nr:hypothetical protein [Baekduia sp.]
MAIRITRLTRIVGLTGVVLALGAGAASARPVALWGCHGPLGQPLGTAGLVATQAGDGTTFAAAGACESATGLVASFSRADPAGGSVASWRANTPDHTTLQGARTMRTVVTAAAPYGAGTPQRYLFGAGGAPIESINVLDVWATPPGIVAGAASGGSAAAGVDCPRPAGERCTAAAPGAVTLGALVLDVDDPAPPRGSVGGLRSPVRGGLTLEVEATDDGSGLATARAIVDGAPVGQVALDAGCVADLDPATPMPDAPLHGCAHQATRMALALDLGGQSVGAHRLQVRVADAAGNEADVYDGELAIAGPDPVFTPTVTLKVGDPRPAAPGGPSQGAGSTSAPGTVPQCPRPQLSMALDQRPLHVSHGRPVLRAKGRYRFRGRLTCRVGKVRRSAARGVPVEVLNRVGRRTFGVTGATTTTGGRVTMILSYRSSRTLIFRHRSTSGTSQVRIPITVVRARAAR